MGFSDLPGLGWLFSLLCYGSFLLQFLLTLSQTLSLSLFSFWDPYDANVGVFYGVPEGMTFQTEKEEGDGKMALLPAYHPAEVTPLTRIPP